MARNVTPFFPLQNQDIAYPLSMNMDLTKPGKAIPAVDFGELSGSGDMLHYATRAIVAKNPDGNPRTYFSCNKSVFYEEAGVRTTDTTFADTIQDMAIVDNGSGTPVLLVVFGTGSTVNGNAVRSLSTDTSPWTTNTGATKMTAWFLATGMGGNLYANTGGGASGTDLGRTVLGDNQVSVCPAGDDPTLAATFSIGEPAGPPQWGLTKLVTYQGRPVAARPDGLWVRDVQEGAFVNKLDRIENFSPHGANGKATIQGENCIWYPTYDGELYQLVGNDISVETPMRDIELPEDMKLGRVESMIDLGATGYAVLSCFSDYLAGKDASDAIGLRVFKEDGGVVTEITSSVCDGSLSTGAVLGALGQTTQDYIVFGSRVKLAFVGLRTTRKPNSAVQSWRNPATMNGSGTWSSLGTIKDATVLGTSGVSGALIGFPPAAGDGFIGWTALNGWDLAELDTYNSISGLYWYRLETATTTGFTATFEVDEAFAGIARPPLPNEGILTASTNFTGRDKENAMSRVLEFRREGGRIRWSQKYSIYTHGGVTALALSPAPGTISNSGPRLLWFGRFSQGQIAETRQRDAVAKRHARTVQFTSTEAGPMLAVVGLRLGDPRRLTRLYSIEVAVKRAQAADRVQVILVADGTHVYALDPKHGSPAVWDLEGLGELATAWEWDLYVLVDDAAQTQRVAPHIVLGLIEHEDVGEPYRSLMQHPDFATAGEEAA